MTFSRSVAAGVQCLIHERRPSKDSIVRHLIVRGPVRIESCCVQIIQFVEFNGDCKASIQSVPFLQEVLHHPDVRARKDKLDIRESVVDDILERESTVAESVAF